jgi:hypothetical protein
MMRPGMNDPLGRKRRDRFALWVFIISSITIGAALLFAAVAAFVR